MKKGLLLVFVKQLFFSCRFFEISIQWNREEGAGVAGWSTNEEAMEEEEREREAG